MLEELRKGWGRFWAQSWWRKGPILGGNALIAIIIGIAVASGGGGDETVVLEAAHEPTRTVTAGSSRAVRPSPLTAAYPRRTIAAAESELAGTVPVSQLRHLMR